jgi:hypothetical protein
MYGEFSEHLEQEEPCESERDEQEAVFDRPILC